MPCGDLTFYERLRRQSRSGSISAEGFSVHPDHAVEQPQLCKHGDDEADGRQRQVEEDEAGEEEKLAEGGERGQVIDLYRTVILAKAA